MIWLLLLPVFLYFFIILEIHRNLRRIKAFTPELIPQVKVSVVIACRNEEMNLPYLLHDLSLQDYNCDLLEVIVADDNSSDRTFSLATEFKGIKHLKVLKNPSEGKKSAVKAGVDAASGKLIITTDADCRTGERWISTISAFYSKTKPDMIIAPVQLEDKPGFSGRFRELEFISLQGITAGTAESGKPAMCNAANLAFTKDVFSRHYPNLHNGILSGDDIFLLHSLKREKNSKICWLGSREAIVTTGQAESLCSFLKQRSRWISKTRYYDDRYTLLLSIVTFLAVFTSVFLVIAGIINQKFLAVFVAAFLVKSIPDYLILWTAAARYNKKHLLRWFIPSQIVYPFYVIIVAGFSLFSKSRWK